LQALSKLAEQLGLSPQDCAQRFGRVTLKEARNPQDAKPWRFHPALGFTQTSGT
jgi:CRISPR-associated endonuclease/helicase Cas3